MSTCGIAELSRCPGRGENNKSLLNFEASDWETKIWIDGKEAGIHRGGYDPFSFNITDYSRQEEEP